MKTSGKQLRYFITYAPWCLLWFAHAALAMDIEEIYELALDADHIIQKAKVIRAGSKEVVHQSNARFWPQISTSAFYSQNSQNRTVHNYNNTELIYSKPEYATRGFNVSITQSLFDYDAIINSKQAQASYELAGIEYADTGDFLILRVITAYFNVLASLDEIMFRDRENSELARHLELTQYRQKLGLSAQIDVNEAKARHDQTQANLETAYIRLSIANEALRQITGQLHHNLDPLGEIATFKLPNPNNLNYWLQTAHQNNLQLKSVEQQLQIAQVDIKKQRSPRFPYLSLNASYNYYDDLELEYVGTELETGSITARLNWNFYQGGLIGSRVRQAEYYKDQVNISLQQQKSLVERKIRDAYYILVGGVTRSNKIIQSINSQKIVLQANKAGYKAGKRANIDVINARTDLFELKRELSQARHNHVIHHAVLKYNAGILSAEDIQAINQYLRLK